ncbi:MAG: Wzz/FepE/Etk N-terminal domain-containing protein, partial [Kiloniellales bacterium]|nr:Wzz/FepE/Etk N-terminal domain-containing protein [Kiloniellales bacterium]
MLFILRTLIRWRKFILSAGLATAVVAAGVSFLLPKWYTATASVFPPETQSPLPGYLDVMQSLQLPIFGPSAVGVRPETIYIDILLSRKVGEQIIDEFGYRDIYKADHTMDAIKELHSHATMSLLENGLLIITFEDRDPERAAQVTNRFIQLLDEFNQQMNITKASRTKEFIAEQMDVRATALSQAEERLRGFQETHRTLILDEQLRAAIEMVADLTAQAVALEVQLEIL